MKIITNGIKERCIIYKLYDNEKVYVGKTTIPIYMRINSHRHGKLSADKYFSEIGWDNVTFEIIDWSYDNQTLLLKEDAQIRRHYMMYKENILNKNGIQFAMYNYFPSDFEKLARNFFDT